MFGKKAIRDPRINELLKNDNGKAVLRLIVAAVQDDIAVDRAFRAGGGPPLSRLSNRGGIFRYLVRKPHDIVAAGAAATATFLFADGTHRITDDHNGTIVGYKQEVNLREPILQHNATEGLQGHLMVLGAVPVAFFAAWQAGKAFRYWNATHQARRGLVRIEHDHSEDQVKRINAHNQAMTEVGGPVNARAYSALKLALGDPQMTTGVLEQYKAAVAAELPAVESAVDAHNLRHTIPRFL